MPDITRSMALEIADNWDTMAAQERDAKPTRRETLRECADVLRMMADMGEPAPALYVAPAAPYAECAPMDTELDRLRRALVDHNEALRSAAAVAGRNGGETNWGAFRAAVDGVLSRHHGTTNDARAALAGQQEGEP